ncbi:MAG: CaiB/BaiF CoA transferase family protein [Burkholderiaceae bacterium]
MLVGDSVSRSTSLAGRTGPLSGIKVLELAQIMAGPTCGMMLADMGADVIKVEKLPGGDDSRGYKEPLLNGVSAPFLVLNRNKRGIALNLKLDSAKDVLKRMVAGSDVLTENYRKGTLEKLGLGYDVLSDINPRLIYCAVSGYGRSGPMADAPGFDLIAQGFSGLMSFTGHPNTPPAKTGNSIADINAGILAAVGVCAALVERARTGKGQVVETSLMEAAIQQTYWQAAVYFATGVSASPLGSSHPLTAPYQAFACADGFINIGGANQANWERIADALGHSEWKTDHRFKTNTDRMNNLDALVGEIELVTRSQTVAHWQSVFDAAGVPAGPVHSLEQALTHEQTLARAMVVNSKHPKAGHVQGIGHPIKFSNHSPVTESSPPPMLSEHAFDILAEFNYSEAEIEALVAQGAVASPGVDQ